MGAWAVDSFGNDDAADWLYELADQQDLQLVRVTIGQVLAAEGYLDAHHANTALAAAEVVAAALGHATAATAGHEEIQGWLARAQPLAGPALVLDAIHAIDRIVGAQSEVRELWAESEHLAAWQTEVAELRATLQICYAEVAARMR
ncbi:hypothetical protein IGB42_04218 [Andreprevotia sp. IGB-42]|uniref:DUF4259 domain-containing protein n=1 Tax=Andreprevotia sp. IGB-42 TaxID=2497473 RepID=UPI001359F843|nr:DUF4259 domain-containing protein [Andreprevotia sp. IGB-42]KAF0811323.1 hypothetical protein IGB42_04218 [Andreprevotia sp. IGB-42]